MAQIGRPKSQLTLSDVERTALTHQARSMRRDRVTALRARIVLACSEGLSNRDVAARLNLAEHTVGKWRTRFVALRLAGLCNAPSVKLQRSWPGAAPKARAQASALPLPWWLSDGASISVLLGLMAPTLKAQAC